MESTEPRVVTQVKHGMIWIGCFLFLAALVATFLTQQSPLSLIMGRSPKPQKELISVWQKEQSGASALAATTDERGALALAAKDNSVTAIYFDSSGKSRQSAAIPLHDSLLAWAGNSGFVYLHRSTHLLQAYDLQGSPRWELPLQGQPEYAWSAPDGHILVAQNDKGVDEKLILVSPEGKQLWDYTVTNGSAVTAAVANRGLGAAIGVLNLSSATTQGIGYLLDNRGQIAAVTDLGNVTPKAAGISLDGRVGVVAGLRKMVGMDAGGKKTWEVNLKGNLQQMAVSPKGNYTVATVESRSWFGLTQRSSIQAVDYRGKMQWQYSLDKTAVDMAVAQDDSLIMVATAKSVIGIRNNGQVAWGSTSRSSLMDLTLAPQGKLISGLDQSGRLVLWEAK